jgi:hypothetical protein
MSHPAENYEDCCTSSAASLTVCPVCCKRGRPVTGVTLDHHLAPARRAGMVAAAGFCANPDCDVVYFNASATIRKGETLLPVTQKDTGDDVFVCYCFGIKRSDIRRDLANSGITGIPGRISKEIKEGRCDCERKNPQGACCLGTVTAEIEKIKKEKNHD